jgi:hypothetical protein
VNTPNAPNQAASTSARPPAERSPEDWTVRVPIDFLDQSVTLLPKTLKHLLLVIEHNARGNSFAFPSVKFLAKKCGVKARRMQIMLNELTALGWIKIIPISSAHRSGRIILLLRRINPGVGLRIFNPGDGLSEDEIRAIVKSRKNGTRFVPELPATQGDKKTQLRTKVRYPIAHFPAPLIKTNSSEETLKTTTTENPPESSSSFSISSPKKPDPAIDQTEFNDLVVKTVELVGWDHDKARLEIDGWVRQGSSLLKIRNTLGDLARQTKIKTTRAQWLCSMMQPGRTGPDGPLPPAKAKGADSPASLARKQVARLKAMGWGLKLDANGKLEKFEIRDPAERVNNVFRGELNANLDGIQTLLSTLGGSTHASPC